MIEPFWSSQFQPCNHQIMDLKKAVTHQQTVGDPTSVKTYYVCDCIFQNEEEIKNHPTQSMGTPVPGT